MFLFNKSKKNKTVAIVVLAVIVILGCIGFLMYRSAIFSKEVLRLEILGPATASVGEEIEYTVTYKNNGNFALESPKLVFELPDNSLTEDSKNRIVQDLPDLYPGQEKNAKFKARLLGKEGEAKLAQAVFSYTPHNLSVRYESDTTFTTTIANVPITLTYDLPSKAERGKEVTYSINYFSNVDYPLENLSIKLGQVDGFKFISSNPISLDSAEYKLSTLEKTKGGRVSIRGIVTSDQAESLHFSARLGMWIDGVFVTIKEVEQDVQVIQPMLFVSQQINGSANYSPAPGELLHYEIFIRNLGSTAFENVFATVKLSGQYFDTSTMQSSLGVVQPQNGLMVFDGRKISGLARLGANQEAVVDFYVRLRDSVSNEAGSTIKNIVTVLDVNQEFTNKVSSKLQLVQKATQSGNSTYTISWQVKNGFNDVNNIKAKVVIPAGVTLGDNISPEAEISHFSWDVKSREIIWLVGNLAPGATKELSFEVTLPFGGSQPTGQATVSGEDQFTGSQIQSIAINQ